MLLQSHALGLLGFFCLLALERNLSRIVWPSYTTAELCFGNDIPQPGMERSDADRARSQDAVSEPHQMCSVHIQPFQLAVGSL